MLSLIREGLSNEEIAERLGISLSGVKFHVSEILSKLGLENRHEAARWRPEEARPWWLTAAAPLLFWRRLSFGWLSPAIAGTLAVAVAAGIGLLVWALVATRGGEPPDLGVLNDVSVSRGCQFESDTRPDADIIADGIISQESNEPLYDPVEHEALASELDDVLSRIREQYPETRDVHANLRYAPGQVIVGLEPPLSDLVATLLQEGSESVNFVTGDDAFDALNASLKLRGVRGTKYHPDTPFPYGLRLCFDSSVNVPAASAAYGRLRHVAYGEPISLSDVPDLDALREGDTWYVAFNDASGDCPAGCIVNVFSFFTVRGERVTAVPESQAMTDPRFVQLLELVDPYGHPSSESR